MALLGHSRAWNCSGRNARSAFGAGALNIQIRFWQCPLTADRSYHQHGDDSCLDPNETPLIEAALISESTIWMPPSLATISAVTAVERSGAASVGVTKLAAKGSGCGAEGVRPSHGEKGNGQHGKGFGAEAITYWPAGEAAEEGEGDHDPGSKPGRGWDADRRRMGNERHP